MLFFKKKIIPIVQTLVCNAHGAARIVDAKYCPQCGKHLESKDNILRREIAFLVRTISMEFFDDKKYAELTKWCRENDTMLPLYPKEVNAILVFCPSKWNNQWKNIITSI